MEMLTLMLLLCGTVVQSFPSVEKKNGENIGDGPNPLRIGTAIRTSEVDLDSSRRNHVLSDNTDNEDVPWYNHDRDSSLDNTYISDDDSTSHHQNIFSDILSQVKRGHVDSNSLHNWFGIIQTDLGNGTVTMDQVNSFMTQLREDLKGTTYTGLCCPFG